MQNLQLTSEEAEVLRDLLHHGLSEMDTEILHTDTHSFKEMLRRRRAILEQVMNKLGDVALAA